VVRTSRVTIPLRVSAAKKWFSRTSLNHGEGTPIAKRTTRRLRSSIITVMQATQSRSTHDRTPVARPNSARRCSFVQAKVSSVFMVVADIVGEKALQVALVEGYDVIQKVTATTLHPAISVSVAAGTLYRCTHA